MIRRLILVASFLAAGCAQQRPTAASQADQPVRPGPSIPVSLSGRITDQQGQPIEGVKITLYSGLATRWAGQVGETGADGRYRFDPLETGAFTLDEESGLWSWYTGMRLEHPDFASVDGRTWWDVTTTIREGSGTVRDFTLTRAGRIHGLLKDHEGFPIGELDLRIMTEQEGLGSVYATTDHKGRFTTLGLTPGMYIVQWNAGYADYAELGRVTVTAGDAAPLEMRVRITAVPAGDPVAGR